jgi:hypothetical protein
MTVQNTAIRKAGPSQGNGINTSFSFTFKVFLTSEVLVTYLTAIGTELVLVLATDYAVALNPDQSAAPGGTVDLVVAPATGTYITLSSRVANTQNLLLTNAGGFYPQSINDALDRIVIQVQQLAEQISRAAVAPVSGIGTQNPASLVFSVNSLGIPVLSALANIALTAVSSFMATVLGSSNATSAQTALGLAGLLEPIAVGTLITFAGPSPPSGYLMCPLALSNISRTTYSALFAAIGIAWGAGDGSTTFGLPFFPADYAPVQASANVGSSSVGAVISHTHSYVAVSVAAGMQPASTATYTATATAATGATGGAANLAAGKRVLFCIKY